MTCLAVMLATGLIFVEGGAAEDAVPVACWSFDPTPGPAVADTVGDHAGVVRGAWQQVAGVVGQAGKFDGGLVSVPSVPTLQFPDARFSIAAWVNPYELDGGQQMIIAKNVYSADQREWGLMLDSDNRFRFYLWRNGWQTLASPIEPRPGHWYHVAVTFEKGHARLYVNGKQEAEGALAPSASVTDVPLTIGGRGTGGLTPPRSPVSVTDAPLTIGGVQDGERIRQTFAGALDEVSLYRGMLPEAAIRALADQQTTPHKIEIVEPMKLWGGDAVPKTADLPVLHDVRFSVIKPYEFQQDGYRFLHGVALCFHNGKLYASFGHNQGGENTDSEEARYRVSEDDGRTWSAVKTIDAGEPGLAVSHGVFLSHQGSLWAFHGSYRGTMQGVHTRAYRLNETTEEFEKLGIVLEGGFWPMQEPQQMADGNWIMAGIAARGDASAGGQHPAAVAISRGDDFTRWDLVVIPAAPGLGPIWGESSVIVEGERITNIARYGKKPLALAATSDDCGRTWTTLRSSNLPMATSKPYAGRLSTGQHYLVCSTSADGGGRRAPLTIAVSKPDEPTFRQIFVIRHAEFPEGPGESHARASLSYPYAIEHGGQLYVGYSNNGGNVGRVGEGRELWNNNSAELAVIPISNLRAPP